MHTHKRGGGEPHGKIDSPCTVSNYTQACIRVVTAFGNYLASCTPMHTRAYTCALYAPRVTRASDNLEACISDKQGTRMYFLLPPVSRYPATRIIQRPRPFPVPVLLFLRKFPSFLLSPSLPLTIPLSIDRSYEITYETGGRV